jgi:hypothetical protein
MACGCVAQGREQGSGKPVCVVHLCLEPAASAPDLTGRRARCSYYGAASPHMRGRRCASEQPSSLELAFFVHHPDREFDEFYCGCWGWD